MVCEHYQRSFEEYESSTTVVESSKKFKSSKDKYSGSASLEGSYKLVSAKAKASWNNIFETTDSSESYKKVSKSTKITFNAAHYQIFRKVKTTLKFPGISASENTETYVQDHPKGQNLTDAQLLAMSAQYMAEYYGVKDGKPYYEFSASLKEKGLISKNLIEALIQKWNSKNKAYEGWVRQYGYDRDEYGVRETNTINEDLNKLFHSPNKTAVEKSLTAAKSRHKTFVNWVNKWGYDRDKYGQGIWDEYKRDLESLLRSASA